MVGERPKHPDPVKHPAYGQAAHRPQGQCDQQCNSHIVQALEGQHVGQLPAAHAHGLEHTELLLAGEQIGDQGVGKVNQGKYKDKDQDAVVPGQLPPQAALQFGGQVIQSGDCHPLVGHGAEHRPPQLIAVLLRVEVDIAGEVRNLRVMAGLRLSL